MYHLAFETSCDDTSIAVFENERMICMKTRSQIEHEETRGVVPEVAARLHANVIFDVLTEVLDEAKVPLAEIKFISCTSEPGLMPSLLVGKTVAKTLAQELVIPLQWINHIEGHIFANLLERSPDELHFPAVVLTVSGGHNELYIWKNLYELELIGQTRDDAAGEAFDKVAKAMGLGFPGGPIISRLADEWAQTHGTDTARGLFPVPLLETASLDFSFSGLKSAVKREIDERSKLGELTKDDISEISFEFQRAVIEVLVTKLFRATTQYGIDTVMLAGGVSANTLLRDVIQKRAQLEEKIFFAPTKRVFSMDNAAMIGMRGWYENGRSAVF